MRGGGFFLYVFPNRLNNNMLDQSGECGNPGSFNLCCG